MAAIIPGTGAIAGSVCLGLYRLVRLQSIIVTENDSFLMRPLADPLLNARSLDTAPGPAGSLEPCVDRAGHSAFQDVP